MTWDYRITRVTTPATSLALITLAQAKAMLGITDNSQDAAITAQITQVSAAIDNYCDRIFAAQTYSDQFRYVNHWLEPGKPLRTRQFPIGTVTVTEDGVILDAAAYETDTATGAIYRLNGSAVASWTGATIIISYVGGYADIPADVEAAALEWLGARWQTKGRDPALRSVTVPDLISQTWAMSDAAGSSIPPGTRDLLLPYRLWSA